jgi:hypothetical protein
VLHRGCERDGAAETGVQHDDEPGAQQADPACGGERERDEVELESREAAEPDDEGEHAIVRGLEQEQRGQHQRDR